jgi:hypothetical protein
LVREVAIGSAAKLQPQGLCICYTECTWVHFSFAIMHLGAFCIENAPTLVAINSCLVATGLTLVAIGSRRIATTVGLGVIDSCSVATGSVAISSIELQLVRCCSCN